MKILNSKGFSAVEVLLVVIIVGLIGGTGYYLYTQNQDSDNNKTADTQNSTQPAENTDTSTPQATEPATKTYKGATGISFEYPADWKVVSSGAELGSEDSLVIQTSDFVESSSNRPSTATAGAKIIYTAEQMPGAVAERKVNEANYTASIKIVKGDIEHQFRIDTSSKAAFDNAVKVLDQMASSFK